MKAVEQLETWVASGDVRDEIAKAMHTEGTIGFYFLYFYTAGDGTVKPEALVTSNFKLPELAKVLREFADIYESQTK